MDGSGGTVRAGGDANLDPIAIIGIACRFPGAPDLASFERLLFEGRDSVSYIPDGRWAKERFFHPERGQSGKAYTFAAGVLEQVDRFDPAFFGISPREAAQMDPQQRLLLELAHEAFEHAGLDGSKLAGSNTGVFVGGSSWDHVTLRSGDPAIMDAYSMTGGTLCALSNRVSYAFDLRGPSFTVDTACSSSLVALHQACEAIRAGTVQMAMVGAANLLLAPQGFVGFSAASMLSPTGRCHAFGARADGYVRAEGGAMLLLRPLRDALAAGDTLHGLVHATGVNSDGRTHGFSLPNQAAQAMLLRDTYDRFGIKPDDLAFVEAHGTGTPAGDPIEAAALGEALGWRREHPLPIGSVKSNIGHLEAASGMAGLIKAILALARGVVPASLHSETPNPAIPFVDLNLVLVQSPLELPQDRFLAGVNSFGFGGTNAHAVLGCAPATNGLEAATPGDPACVPLLLSARSEGALRDLASNWRAMLLDGDTDPALLRGAALNREQHTYRLVVAPGSAAHVAGHIEAWLAGRGSRDVAQDEASPGRVALVFSGNGSQWPGMGADAAQGNPAFLDSLAEVDSHLQPLLGWSVVDRIGAVDGDALQDTMIAQPLLFAVQVATTEALRAAGISADLFMGHSVGEIAAAWAAGALSLDQACRVVAERSRLQACTSGHGRMAVLGLDPVRAADILGGTGVEIAALNASAAITAAGPTAALAALSERARRDGWAFSELALDHAFHSAAMDPVEAPLLAALNDLDAPPCPVSFVSTVTGGVLPAETRLDASYWWRNVREKVDFAGGAATLVAHGARILIEIGPQPVLQAYLNDALRQGDVSGRVLPSLSQRTSHGRDPIALLAMRCHAAGCDMRRAEAFSGPVRHRGLPSYPWQRERHWLGATTESHDVANIPVEHPLLGSRTGPEPVEWLHLLGDTAQPWLADHIVGGAMVVPGAALLEMALATARARHPTGAVLEVRDFEIARPLSIEHGHMREVRTKVAALGTAGTIEIASRPRFSDDPWTVHAVGRVSAASNGAPARAVPDALAIDRCDLLNANALYHAATRLGLCYGPAFQTVSGVTIGQDASGIDVALTASSDPVGDRSMLLPPTVLDGAFQGLLALAPRLMADGGGVLPWRFGRVRLLRTGVRPATARLRVRRVGPRSICADLLLLDATDRPVAEALDCWFVRVALGSASSVSADSIFHCVQSPSPVSPGPEQGAAYLRLALDAARSSAEPGEAGLLSDAFAAAVADDLVRTLLDQPGLPFDVATLLSDGRVAPAESALLDRLMGWLEQDGIARQDAGRWQLADTGDVSSNDVLATLAFDVPGAAADATLLAWAAERLTARLQDGVPPDPAPAPALTDQVLHASPAGQAAASALIAAVAGIAQAWPAGRPLRVLQVAAGVGTFSRQLLRAAQHSRSAEWRLDAATSPDGHMALAEALASFDNARAVAWPDGEPPAETGPYDVIVGFCALAAGELGVGVAADRALAALPALAPGGVVLLAEPVPNRFWTLVWPASDERLRDPAAWCEALTGAGLAEPDSELIEDSWPACLIGARIPALARPVGNRAGRVLLVADPADTLAVALSEALGRHGGLVAPCTLDELAIEIAGWERRPGAVPSRIGVVVSASGPLPAWLDGIAQIARAMPEGMRLTVCVRAAAAGEPVASAIGGLLRVVANESPDCPCRLVRLDRDLPDREAASRAADEMLRPDAEREVCWAAPGRTVPRFRMGWPATKPRDDVALRLSVARPGRLDTVGWDMVAAPPAPKPGEVLIRVRAAGLNFRDVMWALGVLPDEALLDGFAGPTLGLECAGEIVAAGEGVTGLAEGDRVMAFAPASMASYATSMAHAVMRMPDGMDFAAASTVPVAFLTVAYALGHLARLQPNETVLIHGGAGGVGLAAIQYARSRGAVIYATAGSEPKRALLRRLGVDVVLDSRSLDFADEVLRRTDGHGVHVVLNSLSGEAMERSLGLMRPFGRFLELGKRDFYGNTSVGLRPLRHNVSYFAVDADQLPLVHPELAAALFAEVAGAMAAGSLRPLPYRAFAADDVVASFRLMQAAGHVGKVVLDLGAPGPTARKSPPSASAAAVRADRTYVVSGGLGGFGLEAARWLARRGARHLALLGRRGEATPGAAAAIAELRASGVDARAFACDVAEENRLAGTLDLVRAEMPSLAGVIHAAVVMDDALLPELNEIRFASALHVKLGGAEALDRLTRPDRLDLFVLFSSVTTVLGNPGQAAYVAANAAAEAVIERRRAQGLPGLAVQWGPIGDAGYLTREVGVARILAKRLGGRMLKAADALDMLPALLASGRPVVGVADIGWGALAANLALLRTPMFDALSVDDADGPELDLRELLLNSPAGMAQAKLADMLTGEIARIMKTSAGSIGPHRPLSELGMDSLMAVELRLAVEQRFGLTIPVLALSEGATITALAGRMCRTVLADGGLDGQQRPVDDVAARLGRFETLDMPGDTVVELVASGARS